MTDQDFISIANAQAWDEENRDISLTHVTHNIQKTPGVYSITFGTDKGTEVTGQGLRDSSRIRGGSPAQHRHQRAGFLHHGR